MWLCLDAKAPRGMGDDHPDDTWTTSTIEHRIQDIESAAGRLMDATFEETDRDRKTRMAAVELKLWPARERMLARGVTDRVGRSYG